MQISRAEYREGQLHLTVPARDALRWLNSFKEGKDYDITPHKNKRSNRANRYAWELIGEISRVLGLPVTEVYRNAVKGIAGLTYRYQIPHGSLIRAKAAFCNGHLGRDMEIVLEGDDYDTVLVTYGSSDYNSREMAQMIDSLTADARELGIDTIEDIRLKAMLEDMDGQKRI